jgi:hypothetical protein
LSQRKLNDQYKFLKKNLSLITTTLIARAKAIITNITNQVPSLANSTLLHKKKGGQLYFLLIGIIMNMWQQ